MIALVVAIYCLLLALGIWVILIRPARPWSEKVGMLLQIVGLYTFAFGVVTETEILPSALTDDLSSPDLFRFLSANTSLWSIVSSAVSMALDPEKTSLDAFAFLQLFGSLAVGVLSIPLMLFYLVVVAPLSYVAYVLVSLPVSAIATASQSFVVDFDGESIDVQDVIVENSVIIKNFLISFSSLALKVSLDMIASFRRGHPASETRRVSWVRRPRVARALSLGSQVILALLLFLVVVNALVLPFLFDQEVDGPTPIGEVIGAEIVMALAVCALTVAFVKTRRRRRMTAPVTVEEAVAPVV